MANDEDFRHPPTGNTSAARSCAANTAFAICIGMVIISLNISELSYIWSGEDFPFVRFCCVFFCVTVALLFEELQSTRTRDAHEK